MIFRIIAVVAVALLTIPAAPVLADHSVGHGSRVLGGIVGVTDDLAALAERVTELEVLVGSIPPGVPGLEARVSALEAAVAANTEEIGMNTGDITALTARVAELERLVGFMNRFGDAHATASSGSCSDRYLAEVFLTAATYAPPGTAIPEGQLLAISSNTALFSLIGTLYGGDGRVTFALPDLRGLAPEGVGYVIVVCGLFPPR